MRSKDAFLKLPAPLDINISLHPTIFHYHSPGAIQSCTTLGDVMLDPFPFDSVSSFPCHNVNCPPSRFLQSVQLANSLSSSPPSFSLAKQDVFLEGPVLSSDVSEVSKGWGDNRCLQGMTWLYLLYDPLICFPCGPRFSVHEVTFSSTTIQRRLFFSSRPSASSTSPRRIRRQGQPVRVPIGPYISLWAIVNSMVTFPLSSGCHGW